ncbi:MAG: type II secretion system protein [Sedimentisphaeraceae bacterium JB056]
MKIKNSRGAFTLIELLVVISIIAVLMSILMPALSKAKLQAKVVVCKSNLHQLTIGAITYEADNDRLPEHFSEIARRHSSGGYVRWPNLVGGNTGDFGAWAATEDVRITYGSYVEVNFFHCPFIKDWDKSLASVPAGTRRVYVDYNLIHGYFGDRAADDTWATKPWGHSSRPWVYKGKRMNVLICDRLYRNVINPGRFDIRANHPGKIDFKYFHRDQLDEGGAFLDSFYYNDNFTEDVRLELQANYGMRDGSVVSRKGGDDSMVEVEHPGQPRDSTLMPSGF